MNRKFTAQLLKRIKKTPAHQVEMNVWIERHGEQMPEGAYRLPLVRDVSAHPEFYECGTTGCCAGHAVLVDIELTRQAIEEVQKYEAVSFGSVAGHLIGISYDLRRYLFDKDAWSDEYLDMSDQEALIAILERALEEDSFDFLYN